MAHFPKALVITGLFIVLTGCSSYSEPWPSLTSPLPEKQARVSGSYAPAAPIVDYSAVDASRMSLEEAVALYDGLPVAEDSQNLDQAAVALKAAKDSGDNEGYDLAWTKTQLYLSRLSQDLSQMKDILGVIKQSGKSLKVQPELKAAIESVAAKVATVSQQLNIKP